MPKSMVEKYEQILAEDPSSAVFVELAKVLIDQGEYQRAIEICRTGLSYRNDSFLGRVLWGKALIHLGRAAQAMEQFEQAVAIDRNNAYPYGLVAEVLIQRALYRSAVPLLKKAASLQPANGQIRELLEQTQRALAGGPAPVLKNTPLVDSSQKPNANPAPPPERDRKDGELTQVLDAAVVQAALAAKERKANPAPKSPASPARPSPPKLEKVAPASAPTILGGLLSDVPEFGEVESRIELPKVQVSQAATEAIADQYEKELRQRLDEASAQKTFWQAHWLKAAFAAVLLVGLAFGGANYWRTHRKNKGRDLKDAMAFAKKELVRDTPNAYRNALVSLSDALSMDDSTEEAWALSGYIRSILYAEYGGNSEDRQKAQAALARPAVQEKFPGLVLVAGYHLADRGGKESARKSILSSSVDQSEVQELAGKILLAQHGRLKEGLARFDRALKLFPNNVRALTALGDYYRGSGDCTNALGLYLRALQVSPSHGFSVVGAAECRLELLQDFEDSLKQVEALPRSDDLPPDLVTRRELARGRLLALSGRTDEAVQALNAGLKSFRARAYEFELALGEAKRIAGSLNEAEKHYENASGLNRQSEEAKEGLGRVLLAHGLERDLLARIPAQPTSRRASLVRGIAFAQLLDWKHARSELFHTQLNGKYPSEAAIYLSLADAAQGQSDRAVEILEKMLATARRAKGEIRVALGKIYWDRGALDKARAQFEEASKELLEYEGACSLGRLFQKLGLQESAVAPLVQAVGRNPFHAEARYALAQVYLELGRSADALKLLERAPDPLSAEGRKYKAQGLYAAGMFKDARASIQAALKTLPEDVAAHRIQAAILFALGDGKQAMKALERANRLDPADPHTFCEIGRGFLRQNNQEMAQKAFAAAKNRKPDLPCAVAGEQLARLGAGSSSAGAKAIGDTLQTQGAAGERSFVLAALSRLKLHAGNTSEARKLAEESIRLSPFDGEGYLALGLAAHKIRDDDLARTSLQKATELDPSSARAHLALADLRARGNAGDLSGAISEYETFLALSQGNDEENRVKRALSNLRRKVAAN